jgi:hypothetical protein
MSKRKKVGDFSVGDSLPLILLVGGGIAVYFIGQKFNLWGNGGTPAGGTEGATTTTAVQTAVAAAAANADPDQQPSYDTVQYQTWASAINSAGNILIPALADSGSVLAIMGQIDNVADIDSLILSFGQQQHGLLMWQTSYDLPSYIHAAFTASDIASFNQQLAYNNVSFSW